MSWVAPLARRTWLAPPSRTTVLGTPTPWTLVQLAAASRRVCIVERLTIGRRIASSKMERVAPKAATKVVAKADTADLKATLKAVVKVDKAVATEDAQAVQVLRLRLQVLARTVHRMESLLASATIARRKDT